MSFYVECDWCGAALHGKDHAVMPVTIKRQRQGRLDAQWAEEVRPTRHFCAGESYNLDRLGLPDGALGEDASCFQRAMAAVKGIETAAPNLGMEWRLVAVDTPASTITPARKAAEPVSRIQQVTNEHIERTRAQGTITNGPGGIGHLPIDSTTYWCLRRADLLLIEQVEAKTDQELLALPNVGPKRLEIIRSGIATWRLTLPGRPEGVA